MEGLLYYLISDERSKPTPEEFDWKLGTPQQKLAELYQDLTERYELFFNFLWTLSYAIIAYIVWAYYNK